MQTRRRSSIFQTNPYKASPKELIGGIFGIGNSRSWIAKAFTGYVFAYVLVRRRNVDKINCETFRNVVLNINGMFEPGRRTLKLETAVDMLLGNPSCMSDLVGIEKETLAMTQQILWLSKIVKRLKSAQKLSVWITAEFRRKILYSTSSMKGLSETDNYLLKKILRREDCSPRKLQSSSLGIGS